MTDPLDELRTLRARLERPLTYPERDRDHARFLELDDRLYRDRVTELTDREARQEFLSLADRLRDTTPDDHTSQSLWQRQAAVMEVISQRTGLPDLSNWHDMINFDPPREIAPFEQAIADAEGRLVNLDYYPVRISRMPTVNGRTMSPEELLNLMRADLTSFVGVRSGWWDLGFATGFEGRIPQPTERESLGATLHIDMGIIDDGDVTVTENTTTHFRLTTGSSLHDGEHPESGTREWGFAAFGPTELDFYTRGVGRPTGLIEDLNSALVFRIQEQWWRSWQRSVAAYVTSHGGTASIIEPTIHHVDWEPVDTFLRRHDLQPYIEAGERGMFHGSPPAGLDIGIISPVIFLADELATTQESADEPPSLDPARDMSMLDGLDAISLDPSTLGWSPADPTNAQPAFDPSQFEASPGSDDHAPSLDPSQDVAWSVPDGTDAMSSTYPDPANDPSAE